jgi:ATP-dependent DNA ligase
MQANTAIFDSESIAYDPQTKNFLLFKKLFRENAKSVDLSRESNLLFMFFVFFIYGSDLIAEPSIDREKLLDEHTGFKLSLKNYFQLI